MKYIIKIIYILEYIIKFHLLLIIFNETPRTFKIEYGACIIFLLDNTD